MLKHKDNWTKWQKRSVLIIVFLGLLCWAPMSSMANEVVASTETLEDLVSQWVELKRQIALEKESWQGDLLQLQNERALLQQEKRQLQKELKQASESRISKNAQRMEMLEKKEKYQTALAGCQPMLRKAENALQHWQKRLPLPLLDPLVKHFRKLKNTSEKSISQRLQVILALYAQIESYQYSVNVGKQVIEIDENRRLEFDVLYLGLAQGYCVSQDGKYAGIGTLEMSGWVWQWRPELAARIKKCLDLHAREKIAEFVPLPVRLKKDAL
jgi:uncharacterized protein DUF3450